MSEIYTKKYILELFQRVYEDIISVSPIKEYHWSRSKIVELFEQHFGSKIQIILYFLDFYLKNPDTFPNKAYKFSYKDKIILNMLKTKCERMNVWKLTIHAPITISPGSDLHYSVILDDRIYYYELRRMVVSITIYPCRCFITKRHRINKHIIYVEYYSDLFYKQSTAITPKECKNVESQGFKSKILLKGWEDKRLKLLNDDVLCIIFKTFIRRMSDITLMHLWSYVGFEKDNTLLYRPILMEEIARRTFFYMNEKHKVEYKHLCLYYMTLLFKRMEKDGDPNRLYYNEDIHYMETEVINNMFIYDIEDVYKPGYNNIDFLIKAMFFDCPIPGGSYKLHEGIAYYSITDKTFYKTDIWLESCVESKNRPEGRIYTGQFMMSRVKSITGLYNIRRFK